MTIDSHIVQISDNQEKSLVDLWLILWRNNNRIIFITLFSLVSSILLTFFMEKVYRAEAILAPIQEESANIGSPQFGIAASLAGINVNQSSPAVRNAMAIIQSRGFIRDVIAKHELAPILMARKCTRAGFCSVDSTLYDLDSNSWLGKFSDSPPSEWKLYKEFSEILSVSENGDAGLVSVAIDWPDPRQAAAWVNTIVDEINQKIKQTDLLEANSAIEYLTEQVSSTQLVDLQRVFYQLIESQMRVVVLADVRDEYVFRIIDAAAVAEEPIAPNRILIVLVITMMGFFAACILFLMKSLFRESNTK